MEMSTSLIPPTLLSIDILLSLSIINRLLSVLARLLRPSYARPPLIEPSPMMATTCSLLPRILADTARPKAAEMELDAWPATKASYSLSAGEGNGLMPFSLRFV